MTILLDQCGIIEFELSSLMVNCIIYEGRYCAKREIPLSLFLAFVSNLRCFKKTNNKRVATVRACNYRTTGRKPSCVCNDLRCVLLPSPHSHSHSPHARTEAIRKCYSLSPSPILVRHKNVESIIGMSLPPQMLRIKRKRVEDPVDALYLESQHNNQKRRATEHASFVFRRLHEDPTANQSPPQTSPPHKREASPVVDTGRKADVESSTESSPFTQKSYDSTVVPRRFYLSKDELYADTSVIGKRKSSQRETSLATFVAESARTRSISSVAMDAASLDRDAPEDGATPRKQPKTKAVRREKNATPQPTVSKVSKYTQEEAMRRHAKDLDDQEYPPSAAPVPPPNVGDDAMDTSDDEYTYDTYLRFADNWAEPGKKLEGQVGYLVIPEADQTLWETYYDSDADSEDERDWDSEQDDENAENFYGADYPEDEVDSADELDGDPYQYHRGSEDEEYGSEDDAYSNGESERLNSGNVRGLRRLDL